MNNLLRILILLFSFSNLVYGQNTFFIGKDRYPCTKTFKLISKKEYFGQEVDVIIVKNGDAGMIALSTEIPGGESRIKGDIFIFLNNGTVITCIDRGVFDHVDQISTTIYYLTKKEINSLRNSNISFIRYSLKCIKCRVSEGANYSVHNIKNEIKFNGDIDIFEEKTTSNSADVTSLIEGLFGFKDNDLEIEASESKDDIDSNEKKNRQYDSDCGFYMYSKKLVNTSEQYRYLYRSKTFTNASERVIRIPEYSTLYVVEESSGSDIFFYVCYNGYLGYISKNLLE